LKGYPVVLSDTAGLREETQDTVEQEGVVRAIKAANQADILVFVQDAGSIETSSVSMQDFGLEDTGQVCLTVLNKIDLVKQESESNQLQEASIIRLSGKTGQGIDDFLETLCVHVEKLCRQTGHQECPGITRDRHKLHLQKAVRHLGQYLDEEILGSDLVICAHQLRKAVREIGHISGGKVSSEKILDVIFADFCIGK
jgi:tRNA modification GTPase